MPRAWLPVVVGALAGCTAPVPTSGGTGTSTDGVVVVCSDFLSSAVALLDRNAESVTAPLLIHSGSRPPGLQTALGGDLALPTTPPPDGTIVLIDRHPNSALTVVDPTDGTVLRQVSVATGFAANPHDVVFGPDGHLLVTRHQPNPSPSRADGLDGGDDLLVFDPDGVPVARLPMADTDGPARPDRLLEVAAGRYWVSLNRVSVDWTTYAAAAIAVVTWDGTSAAPDEVERMVLDDLRNCSAMARSDDGGTLAVTCSGAWRPGVGGYDREASGLILFDPDGQRTGALHASDDRLEGVLSPSVTLAGDAVYLAEYGDNAGRHDRVLRWEPADDALTVVYEASAAWVVWSLAKSADGVPLMPDANRKAPHVCRLVPGAPVCLDACGATGLPPTALSRFGQQNRDNQ